MYHSFFLPHSIVSNTHSQLYFGFNIYILYRAPWCMLAAVLKIFSTSMIEEILTYTQNHPHTRKKYSTARSYCNERKINSKRKIVTKVLLTWSKIHYHNGNSCFGRTIVSLFFFLSFSLHFSVYFFVRQ